MDVQLHNAIKFAKKTFFSNFCFENRCQLFEYTGTLAVRAEMHKMRVYQLCRQYKTNVSNEKPFIQVGLFAFNPFE